MMLEAVEHPVNRRSHVRWIVIVAMCCVSFISYVLRTNISIAGDVLMKDLHLTEIQLGMVFAAFAWGYAIFQFPGGVLGDVYGSRKSLTICGLLWAVLTLFTGLVPGPRIATSATILVLLIVLRFITGAVHAPIFPVIGGTIANWFPVAGWALPNGLTSTALTLGAAASAPLIVWLIQIAGWRGSFFITAPLGIIGAVWWWRAVRDYPAQHPGVSKHELAVIDADRPPPVTIDRNAWQQTLRNRNILLLTISYFCMNYIFYLYFNWFFIYLVNVRHVADREAGYLTASQWMIGAIGATLGGYFCDRFARRYGPRWGYRLVPIPALILASAALIAGAITQNSYAAVTFFALCFGLTEMTDAVYWAAIVSVAGRHAASASGILNTGGNVVGGIGALLVPFVAQQLGWTAAIATGSIFGVTGALLWLLVKSDQPM